MRATMIAEHRNTRAARARRRRHQNPVEHFTWWSRLPAQAKMNHVLAHRGCTVVQEMKALGGLW
jgi:hypothetical protein